MYDEAIVLLRKLELAMAAAGRDPDFTEYLGALLDANRKKKSFCGKLRAAWPRPRSLSGMSLEPWYRPSAFQLVSPCRTK